MTLAYQSPAPPSTSIQSKTYIIRCMQSHPPYPALYHRNRLPTPTLCLFSCPPRALPRRHTVNTRTPAQKHHPSFTLHVGRRPAGHLRRPRRANTFRPLGPLAPKPCSNRVTHHMQPLYTQGRPAVPHDRTWDIQAMGIPRLRVHASTVWSTERHIGYTALK